MKRRQGFTRCGVAALLALAWLGPVLPGTADASPKKVKHQLKKKSAPKKKAKAKPASATAASGSGSDSNSPTADSASGSSSSSNNIVLRGPSCPSPGNVGISSPADWTTVISNNLGRTIEICNDLEFETPPQEITYGFSGLAPFESMIGLHGTIEGNGHTIRISGNPDPDRQAGISLGLGEINGGTVQNLQLVGRGAIGDSATSGYVIAGYATDATIRNITLSQVVSSSGLVYEGRRVHFEGVSGDAKLEVGATQRIAGGFARTCEDCSVIGANVSVSLDAMESSQSSPYPTYAGALIGYAHAGSLSVRNSSISGILRRGFDRGMIVGAMDGATPQSGSDGAAPPSLTIENVRVVNVDMSMPASTRSYTSGGLVGRASLPTLISRTLVKNALIESGEQAGGLIGGAAQVTASEVAVHDVRVRAQGVAGGLIAWNSGRDFISDSYFKGEVTQSGSNPLLGAPLFTAGGILGFATEGDELARVYVSAVVRAEQADNAGALIGANEPAALPGSRLFQNAYYDVNQATQSNGNGSALSAQQMLMPASFVGFGQNEWVLRDGRLPLLRNRPAYSVQDLFDFLSLYFAQDVRADVTGDGALSTEDLFRFLEMYHSNLS